MTSNAGNKALGHEGAVALCDTMAAGHVPNLKVLTLDGTCRARTLSPLPYLHYALPLTDCNIGPRGALSIAHALATPSALEKVYVHG